MTHTRTAVAAAGVLAVVLTGCGPTATAPTPSTTGAASPPTPAPRVGSCHARPVANGTLPDPVCTPGATDPHVTQATLGTTICRAGGYTSTVRPPQSVTST